MQLSRRLRVDEGGFTLAVVMLAMLLLSLILVGTVTAVKGDLNVSERDLDRKQAYEAAEAGINDFQYHLNSDTNFWSKCVPSPPGAVNLSGSTTNRKTVPGSSGSSYSIELIPATGKSACSATDSTSMIEGSGSALGTFRIRSTGYAGPTKESVVATFKRSSFLDYVYFTQRETSDPVTYGYTDATAIAGANSQCSKTALAGRYSQPIPGTTDYCNAIYFGSGETINGPLHTNDTLAICGTPTFGRSAADSIEMSAPDPGWFGGGNCGTDNPNFVGTRRPNSPTLTPPATNGALSTVSGVASYSGTVRITLSGTNYTVLTNTGATIGPIPIPTSGVIYVANDSSQPCTTGYSPYTVKDQTISPYPDIGCGNAFISGAYSGQLTIAAENDIVIEGDVCRGSCGSAPSGSGVLGLIANNFVRVNHPFSTQTAKNSCGSGTNSGTTVSRIDAAILSIDHSFIVDHYNCGASLGVLTVNGAISQKYRGPVGLLGTTSPGYDKNYNYDDRLRYISPPQFLDPVETAWHVQRETIDP